MIPWLFSFIFYEQKLSNSEKKNEQNLRVIIFTLIYHTKFPSYPILLTVLQCWCFPRQMEHVEKFNIGEALPLIEKLTKRHRHKILPHLQAVLSA